MSFGQMWLDLLIRRTQSTFSLTLFLYFNLKQNPLFTNNGGFQLEDLSISQVINNVHVIISSALIGGKLI